MSLAEKVVAVMLVLLTIAFGTLYVRELRSKLAGRTGTTAHD